jgi:hypothetical protein
VTITLTGTPAFSGSFALTQGGLAYIGMSNISFSGSATGQRYGVQYYSWINTYGGGANFFPGNSAGVVGAGTYT